MIILRDITVFGWQSKYCSQLIVNVPSSQVVISEKRGRSFYLPDDLYKKLRAFTTHMQLAGVINNRHVVLGVLMSLIKTELMMCI